MATRIKAYPTATEIGKWLRYEAASGKLYWVRSSGRVKAGAEAGAISRDGYRQISIDGSLYLAHRLAWIICHGRIEGGMYIDHENGIPDDNRQSNLRLARPENNSHNQKIRKDNTSSFKGVCWSSDKQKWQASIRTVGKRHFVGYFNCPTTAMLAVEKARRLLHGEFARAS